MAVSFKGAHVPEAIMLTGVRWQVAYPLRTRHVEALMRERGVQGDHATINRWVVNDSPPLAAALQRHKRSVGPSGRMAEPYSTVKGPWYDRDRAVEKTGQTLDLRRTEPRDERAAKRCLTQAIRRHGVPATITLAGSAAHAAAIKSDNQEHGTALDSRQSTQLNHLIAPDQRGVNRGPRPLWGCKACEAAPSTLVGLELRPRLRTGQLGDGGEQGLTPAAQGYALASSSPHRRGLFTANRLRTQNCDRTGYFA